MKISATVALLAVSLSAGSTFAAELRNEPSQEGSFRSSLGFQSVAKYADRAYGNIDPKTSKAWVDVNDAIFISEKSPKKYAHAVDFGVVDGFRSAVGSCEAANKLQDGAPRTTWIGLEYQKIADTDNWKILLARTVRYSKQNDSQVDEFVLIENGPAVELAQGIQTYIKDGRLIYIQRGGLIGPKARKALGIEYNLAEANIHFNGMMMLDSESWSFDLARDRSNFVVNGQSIGGNYTLQSSLVQRVVYIPGSNQAGRDMNKADVITPPVIAEMLAEKSVLMAADESYPEQRLLCPSIQCNFGYQCAALFPETVCDCLYAGAYNICGNIY